ncbi:D-alanine--D-alanine ligase [Longispora fulva]|uniref:D-alanine--D-alanine ligase n=1 Tax=Longispora fulva TaxID=619741 RepID=A0A8J7GRJ7_9ACTN|nr:D-alanine--D-alanine ligase family protein [Longispora fulva]MBG6137399.1 D-alanine-D-alanine ligase [Longispora fulva]GIG61247.1 D-alanine--D-alanine ligase [Longispora fulva]
MTGDARIRVGVLFGGPSAEHDVSCSSALAVVRALPRDRYAPVVVGVTREGDFRLVPDNVLEGKMSPPDGVRAIDDHLEVVGPLVELRPGRPGVAVLADGDVVAHLDVVFPLLHGPFGEDGVLQGLLEFLGVPYVGGGIAASAVGMDKVAMKRAFVAENVPVTPHIWVDEVSWAKGSAVIDGLEYPLFVKPANMGSSIGITRVTDPSGLAAAVDKALEYDPVVIVEQGVTGREIECGVLGGFAPEASRVGEVTVSGGWFDYEQKYLGTVDPMIVPAVLPPHVEAEVRALSVAAFRAVGGWGLARVDFLYDEAADRLYVNELNTMPGFTAHSMYPKVWQASGVSYQDLLDRLIALAFERHARKRGMA